MVSRYVSAGRTDEPMLMITADDLIWFSAFAGGKGFSYITGNTDSTEYIFTHDFYDDVYFTLSFFTLNDREIEQFRGGQFTGRYVVKVNVDSASYNSEQFKPMDQWLYDNEWPLYVDGRAAPYFTFVDDAQEYFKKERAKYDTDLEHRRNESVYLWSAN